MQLFAYGVLIRELARGRAAELIAPLGEASPARVRGLLYAVTGADGWYPILLPDPAGGSASGEVHGVVCEASGVDWGAMDEFEDAHDGPGAEYARRELEVTLPDGSLRRAYAYCYVRAVPTDAVAIAHGSFARWLAETGNRAIGAR